MIIQRAVRTNPLIQKPKLGLRVSVLNPINRGLIFDFPFNIGCGNTVYDVLNAHHIVGAGGPTWERTWQGITCMSFSGADAQYARGPFPNIGLLPSGTGWTVIWRSRNTEASTLRAVLNIQGETGSGGQFLSVWYASGVYNGLLTCNRYALGGAIPNAAITQTDWIWFAVTNLGGTNNNVLYTNGRLNNAGTTGRILPYNSYEVALCLGSGAGYNAPAKISHLSMWNRALSAAEIAEFHSHPYGTPAMPRYIEYPLNTFTYGYPATSGLLLNPDFKGGMRELYGGF